MAEATGGRFIFGPGQIGISGTIRDAGKESVTHSGDKWISAAEDADPCEQTQRR
jgi:hypothetical protein